MQSSRLVVMLRKLYVLIVLITGVATATPVVALDLVGTAAVSITSDTSANAKTMALAEARKQIITDALSQYVNQEQFQPAIQNATAQDLENLVFSSSIDGEQVSTTTYSANITMQLDTNAVRAWLDSKGVQNWVPNDVSGDRFLVQATLSNNIEDWAQINSIARKEKIELDVRSIVGNQITAYVPVAARTAFTLGLRDGGWRYASQNDTLHIWK